MPLCRPVLSCILSALLTTAVAAQQPVSSVSQTSPIVTQALNLLMGSRGVTDVTLTGTVERIAGSDDETGTAVLKAIPGASRMDLTFPSGPRSEIFNQSGAVPAGSWTGPDGASHPIANHNLMLVDPGWFFPAFPISSGLLSGRVITDIGPETRNSQAVEHFSIVQPIGLASVDATISTLLQHLSQIDFYVDSSTILPAAITFNIHPDNDARLDIPIEIRLSDYRVVNGAQVPFHIQRLMNNGLALDVQLSSVVTNSGLLPSTFSIQP